MSETKPYCVVRNPEPSCIFYDVVTANGNRVNFRALRLDEAEHQTTTLNSAFAQGLAAGNAKAKDWPWVDAAAAHPEHGISVAIIPEGDERIAVGFWDRELENSLRSYIVDSPNGSHHVRALWWSYLPPKPARSALNSREREGGA